MTPEQAKALQSVTKGMEDAIRACPNGIPSGHLYAMAMGMGCSLEIYNYLINALKDAGKITESGNVLRGVRQ